MNEIIKIIEGYNEEKKLIIQALLDMNGTYYPSYSAKQSDLKARLAVIDKKIEDIKNSLLVRQHLPPQESIQVKE